MALTKEAVIDKMEVLEDGQISIRTANRILEDGVVISQSYHRKTIAPLDDISGESAKVQATANANWTQEVKDAYQAKLDAAEERELSDGA
jgi:predicted component of type VI protein secretion system|tara:strand:- start:22 stop:291 length:270 start_codon:yes stop_codon:yes gene_type:complete